MLSFLVEATATIVCPHGGKVTPAAVSPRVTLGGAPATTITPPWSIACPAVEPVVRCTLANFKPGATRVFIGGAPAILAVTPGLCPPNGKVNVLVTQFRAQGS